MSTVKRSDIDAAIAVEVMGWDVSGKLITRPSAFDGIKKTTQWLHTWQPSTDANHALEALEKYTGGNYNINRERRPPKHTTLVLLNDKDGAMARGRHPESPTLAICLALLSAVRGETVELEA